MDGLYKWDYPPFEQELPLQNRMMQQRSGPYLTLNLAAMVAVRLSMVWGTKALVKILATFWHMPLFIATSPGPTDAEGFTTGGRSLNPGRALPKTAEWDMIFLLPLPHLGRLCETAATASLPYTALCIVPSPAGVCARSSFSWSHDWGPLHTEKNIPELQCCPRRGGRGLRESCRGDVKVCCWRHGVSSWLCTWQLNASASTPEQFSVRSLRTISVTAQTESTYAALAWFQLIHRGPSHRAPSAASLPTLRRTICAPRAFISLILLAGFVWFTRYRANSISRDKVHVISYIRMLTHMIQFVYLLIPLLIITEQGTAQGTRRVPFGKGRHWQMIHHTSLQ